MKHSPYRFQLIASVIVGLTSIAFALFFQGSEGVVGALFAQSLVLIFFATSAFVERVTRDLEPTLVMVFVMVSYMAKITLFGIFLILIVRLVPTTVYDRTTFGLSSIALALAWLGGEIKRFFSLKLHLDLPTSDTK
jgi:flagellar biosynthesis protein FlhB